MQKSRKAKISVLGRKGIYDPPLYKYGHFLTDCLLPDLKLDIFPCEIIYRVCKSSNHTLGYLKPLYEELFACKVIELSEKEFNALSDIPLYESICYKDSTRRKEELVFLRDRIFEIIQTTSFEQKEYPKIILIKRSDSIVIRDQLNLKELVVDINFERMSQTLERFTTNKLTSKSVDELLNTSLKSTRNEHLDTVEEVLQNVFGDYFKSVVLEELSFSEQINYIKNADLIVGSHGGGLSNSIFAKPTVSIIEYVPKSLSWNSSITIFQTLNINYKQIPQDKSNCKETLFQTLKSIRFL